MDFKKWFFMMQEKPKQSNNKIKEYKIGNLGVSILGFLESTPSKIIHLYRSVLLFFWNK